MVLESNSMANQENLTLLTDLYQLTMAQGYFREQRIGAATFSLFIRSYPPNRGYFVSAGLQDVLDYLANLSFDNAALDYLATQKLFTDDFLDYLADLKFTGEVWAIPEGRIFFKDEPVLEVTAPVIQAQLAETFIINQVHLQSMIATKASRCVHAAAGRPVVDFALRRSHGSDAGMKVARASYLAGFAGTSNVMAGKNYGVPIVGTMAHSFVMSFEHEIAAFRAYAASFPRSTILLIDTYDTLVGARNAATVAREMAERGEKLIGVRIDSGDLPAQARAVRQILDEAGLGEVKILGSGGLDEFDLGEFSLTQVPFDSYGVGTKMGTSADAPWTDISYKMVEYAGRPVQKLSTGKISWPGKKQVFRRLDAVGNLGSDVIGLRTDNIAGAEPLLARVMDRGKALRLANLEEIRLTLLEEFKRLPDPVKAIHNPARYPVEFSPALQKLRAEVESNVANKN
jgi:nicotinate phosphoribosyltransferase